MNKNLFFKDLPIYYVNLDRSIDRRVKIEKSFKRYGITNYKRISAFDGSQHEIQAKYLDYQVILNSAQKAVVFSYFKLIKEFINNEDSEYIVMCDDDIDFANSLKIKFNFYETLQFHNPYYYNLKIVSLDNKNLNLIVPPNVLHKPDIVSYGSATIINKNWARMFLEKYGFLNKDITYDSIYDATPYTQNVNNSDPGWVLPAIDAINFDENTYIWRMFPAFYTHATTVGISILSNEEYLDYMNTNMSFVVNMEISNKDISVDIDLFKRNMRI